VRIRTLEHYEQIMHELCETPAVANWRAVSAIENLIQERDIARRMYCRLRAKVAPTKNSKTPKQVADFLNWELYEPWEGDGTNTWRG